MNSNFTKKETELISRSELYLIRKKKIQNEIEAAIRLLKKNIEPLEVADKFIHNSFKLMKDGILNSYPELTENELRQKIKETLSLSRKIKALRTREKIFG